MHTTVALHRSLDEALALGPPPDDNLAVPVLRHGLTEVELYQPQLVDPQTPHSRDEIYVVARGSGRFFNGEATLDVRQGSLILVPAGVAHRFEQFSDDFAVWVIFYGPEGGEIEA